MTRGKELLKLLKRLIKQEHLYTDDQLVEMKSQIRILEEEFRKLDAQTSKGFGKK